jgi:iron complex outermembrane receptor protein
LFLALLLPSAALAQNTGAISGRVLSTTGAPASDAEVRIVDLRRSAPAGPDGGFRFDNIPAGDYLIEATSPTFGGAIERISVSAGGTATIDFRLDLTVHRDEIVVTAGPDAHSQSELIQATTVLDADDLARQVRGTIGETLAEQPGVSANSWGNGASRPVIRGLGGDRIRVLEGGLGSGDASTTSPDHAVSFDPELANRIEIVRGPATLLYGGSATGGVVNVIDGKIPESIPGSPITGQLDLHAGSNANEQVGAASLDGGMGHFAWHVEGVKRKADDYESGEGKIGNSALDAESKGAGVSYVGNSGFLGVSYSTFDTLYGSPLEEAVKIDLSQKRADLRGELDQPFAGLKSIKVRFGKTDYEHVELEGGEVGTRFLNDSWEGRIEGVQQTFGRLSGSFGLQLSKRDFSAIGEESFVPPTTTDSRALFTFQEISAGALRYQLGARYESQTVEASPETGRIDRDLSGLSGSVGAIWLPNDDWSLGLSLARSVKLPNAEELFSNGPHIATGAFEVGDPTLKEETNLGFDLSLRKRTGRLTGEVSLFANRFDGFIFESFTNEFTDGEEPLQIVRFVARDAEFRGAELSGIYQLYHGEPNHLDLEAGADFVRANLRGNADDPLPRIPPARYRLALHYRGSRLQAKVEGVRAARQDRVAPFETPTAGYNLLNADLSYRFLLGNTVLDVLLRGNNLTDELARNHVSFLKDVAPLTGRDVSLGLRLAF